MASSRDNIFQLCLSSPFIRLGGAPKQPASFVHGSNIYSLPPSRRFAVCLLTQSSNSRHGSSIPTAIAVPPPYSQGDIETCDGEPLTESTSYVPPGHLPKKGCQNLRSRQCLEHDHTRRPLGQSSESLSMYFAKYAQPPLMLRSLRTSTIFPKPAWTANRRKTATGSHSRPAIAL